jgi:hypothetical protein
MKRHPCPETREGPIRTIAVSLIGAAAVAAGVVLLRGDRDSDTDTSVRKVPQGESVPAPIVLERLRRAGI